MLFMTKTKWCYECVLSNQEHNSKIFTLGTRGNGGTHKSLETVNDSDEKLMILTQKYSLDAFE